MLLIGDGHEDLLGHVYGGGRGGGCDEQRRVGRIRLVGREDRAVGDEFARCGVVGDGAHVELVAGLVVHRLGEDHGLRGVADDGDRHVVRVGMEPAEVGEGHPGREDERDEDVGSECLPGGSRRPAEAVLGRAVGAEVGGGHGADGAVMR